MILDCTFGPIFGTAGGSAQMSLSLSKWSDSLAFWNDLKVIIVVQQLRSALLCPFRCDTAIMFMK